MVILTYDRSTSSIHNLNKQNTEHIEVTRTAYQEQINSLIIQKT